MQSNDMIELFLQSRSLKLIHRSGWDIAGITGARSESVAEHSWGTSFIVVILGTMMNQRKPLVDISKALTMAIIHDLPESLIADIPHGAIRLGGQVMKEGKSIAEKAAIESLFQHSPFLETASHMLEELKEHKSIESRLVLSCDILDMLLQAIALERNGVEAKMLDSFFQSSIDRVESYSLNECINIANTLNLEHKNRMK